MFALALPRFCPRPIRFTGFSRLGMVTRPLVIRPITLRRDAGRSVERRNGIHAVNATFHRFIIGPIHSLIHRLDRGASCQWPLHIISCAARLCLCSSRPLATTEPPNLGNARNTDPIALNLMLLYYDNLIISMSFELQRSQHKYRSTMLKRHVIILIKHDLQSVNLNRNNSI